MNQFPAADGGFQAINRGYNSTFHEGRMTLGLVVPIESYPVHAIPDLENHLEPIQLAESLGFSSLWLRDVPFIVPSFGDAGQVFDPFVYLGYLAAHTSRISLGVASIILPLRHPAHTAKAAASADLLSGGRLILGVASGDRPDEYPSMNLPFQERGDRFKEHFDYLRKVNEPYPSFENSFGSLRRGVDILPKAAGGKLPLFVTGNSRQDPDWIAREGDGWMIYPRGIAIQESIVQTWRSRTEAAGRGKLPIMQSLYVDYIADHNFGPEPIHLGFRSGKGPLLDYLKALESVGMNHVAINLRFNQAKIEDTLNLLAEEILPEFSTLTT